MTYTAHRTMLRKGDRFDMTGYSKLEGMETPGTWKVERLGRVHGKPTYVMRPEMPQWDDDELVQHFAEDIDNLCAVRLPRP